MENDLDLSSIMVGYDEAPNTQIPAETSKKSDVPKSTPADANEMKGTDPSPERQALILKLRLHFDTNPAKLKEIKPKKPLDKLTDEQLREVHKNIEYTMGSKNQVGIVAAGVAPALKVVEDLAAQFTPLRIQGTHRVCMDPEVQDLIKYTIIESGMGGIGTTPQQQLAWKLLMAAFQQHTINSAIESMTAEQKQAMAKAMNPAPKQEPKSDDKYADL